MGIDLVGKIGSMALIRREEMDMDYNIFARLGRELRPGMVWISSGATEIGRLDFLRRTGRELSGDLEDVKTDYSAQGQAILMENYRRFLAPEYSLRQLLVEHTHFNHPETADFIRRFLERCPEQNAVPIINYNDPVSFEENRKMELSLLRQNHRDVVECVDNDETADKILYALGKEGVTADHTSLSSDGFGSMPRFDEKGECIGLTYASPNSLHATIQALVKKGLPLEEALKMLTTTPANLLGKTGVKGCVAVGADADLLVLGDGLTINGLFAKGQTAMWDGVLKMKGRFE